MSSLSRLGRGRTVVVAAMLVVVAFQLPFFDRWFSFMDEGHILLFADIIAQGGELYRDATVYPLPGAFYLLALFFEVFEPTNLLARWILVVQYALFAGLLFVWVRKLLSPGFAVALLPLLYLYRIWAFPHWHMYSYSTTALLVLLCSVMLLLRALEREDDRLIAAAGLLYGLGVFCKQDYGAAFLLVVVTVLAVASRAFLATFIRFILPAAAVGLLTLLHFVRQGLAEEFIQLTVLNHFVGMSSYEYSEFPPLFPLFSQDPSLRTLAGTSAYLPPILFNADPRHIYANPYWTDTALIDTLAKLFYYGPYALLAFASGRLWWTRGALRELGRPRALYLGELAIAATGAALFALVQFNRPQDYVHLVVLYWPLLLLMLLYLHRFVHAGGPARRGRTIAVAVVLLVPGVLLLRFSTSLMMELREGHSTPLETERAGIYVTADQAKVIDTLDRIIEERVAPGERVAVMPYFPILHFYADRLGPDRSAYIVWPFPEFPDRDERIMRSLDEDRTELLIYNLNEMGFVGGIDDFAPELFRYLVDHYAIEQTVYFTQAGYKFVVATRQEEPAPGREIEMTPEAGASLQLEPRGGAPLPLPPEVWAEQLLDSPFPLRPTIQLRPSRDGRTVLRVPVDVPPTPVRLETAVAVHPQLWDREGTAWVRFQVEIDGDDGPVSLHDQILAPGFDIEDRGWKPVEIDLAAYAGRRVVLSFATSTNLAEAQQLRRAGFEHPRLVPRNLPSEGPSDGGDVVQGVR